MRAEWLGGVSLWEAWSISRRELTMDDGGLGVSLQHPAVSFLTMEYIMKYTHIMAAASLLMSTTAFAATGDFTKVDVNADGKITLEEGMKLHPDWTAEGFKALDKDADGALSQTEYDTAASAPGASTNTTESTDSTNPAPAATNTTDASSKTNAAPVPDTTANTTASATENSTTVATKRKMGPATYVNEVGANDVLASTLIGMRIYAVESDIDDTQTYPADARQNWNDIGEVNDVVLDWDGSVKAVVLGVGGFLGIGEKNVAIDMASLSKVRESADSNDWFLVVNSSKQAITDAPSYGINKKS
jgi:PRC-barrel domain protein/EF hand domain-containing protein